MPAPVLATKLFIPPPRAKIVLRPHLIERLEEGLAAGCKLTLISAPAGFGKTSLLSEWLAGCETPTAWLSLDEGDNDPTRFLTYFIAALQGLALSKVEENAANIGAGVLSVLQSPQPPAIESILTVLLNEINTLPDNFVFVLDDYHVIDSKPVDHILTFMLEHVPPQMHLVITTREDPHLPLARLRARGQLTELRHADLRFSSAEAAEFLVRVMGLNLSVEEINTLETRTEGWIAGLQMAALSMQGRSDAASFINSFTGSHRFILDYLIEEVLQRQPEHIRTFLLQTAILDRLSASLCDAVTGREDGKALLETLERGNLFIMPLDDQRQWYRYHPLFAEVLQARLLDEQPDQVFSLHQRASQWYEHTGAAADAIRHALAAKDYERAANLVELAVPNMRKNRQVATITELGWLKALPDELFYFRPVLSVDYAYALFAGGEPEAAEARLRDAERWLDTPVDQHEPPQSPAAATHPEPGQRAHPEEDRRARPEEVRRMVVVDQEEFRRLPGMIALLRGAQALIRGDMPETEKNARQVLALAPKNAYLMLGGAASQLGLAAWTSGDLETARRMTADGMLNVRLAGYISPAIGGAIVLADILIAQGNLNEAMTTYERALQWAMVLGQPVLRGAADMYVGMSDLQREHNDLQSAMQSLLTSQSLGELAGQPQNPYRWRAALARIRQAQGDLDAALELLDQAERLYDGNFSPNVRPIAARKVRLWLIQGRLDEALRWARQQGLSVENELSYLHEFDHITLARLLLARYQSEHNDRLMVEALGLLERLLIAAQQGGRLGSALEILVLQAMAYYAHGDLPAALIPLQHALAFAESQGYVRIFLDEGTGMQQLLRQASPRESMPGYIHMLQAAFAAEKGNHADKPDLSTAQPLIEPLSQRELEVLRLIAQGMSNREIGERLFLALDTVKGYNRKIFDKLQVQSRTQAATRARELGLL